MNAIEAADLLIKVVLGTATAAATVLGGCAVYVKAGGGKAAKKKSTSLAPPPLSAQTCQVTRAEHEIHAHRIVLLEETVRTIREVVHDHGEAIEKVDEKLDTEIRDRLDGERQTLREQAQTNDRLGLTNEQLAAIRGRMDGHAEAGGIGPRSRRRS